jgi:hypothetical protein
MSKLSIFLVSWTSWRVGLPGGHIWSNCPVMPPAEPSRRAYVHGSNCHPRERFPEVSIHHGKLALSASLSLTNACCPGSRHWCSSCGYSVQREGCRQEGGCYKSHTERVRRCMRRTQSLTDSGSHHSCRCRRRQLGWQTRVSGMPPLRSRSTRRLLAVAMARMRQRMFR